MTGLGSAGAQGVWHHTYTFDWLLDRLEERAMLTSEVRRDLEVRAPRQRQVLHREGSARLGLLGHRNKYAVSPAELIASLHPVDPSGQEIDEDALAKVLAETAGLPFFKIDALKLDMGFITRTLSCPFALRHVVLPLRQDERGLEVAVDNPYDAETLENLKRIGGTSLRRVVCSKRDILKAITDVFGFRSSVENAAQQSRSATPLGDFEQLVEIHTIRKIEPTDKHVVNAVDLLFAYAFDQRASDIHIEPRRGDSQVRLRIDGILHNMHTIPRPVHPAIASRVKGLARLDIAERRRPQDGRIKTVLEGREVELRVSTMPVVFGEKLVIRIFDPGNLLQDLADLGFDPQDLSTFQRWVRRPHGLVLITGPTGSGKTTTLYTTLQTLSDAQVNITTVEDPIEMVTDAFNQVAVQPRIGVDFASALRTILRQDPDIIMVGEIRDAPTAEMAVQAALTGHLVLSTLHTNDTPSAITRLADLGVPRFLIASTLVGVMAQRLLRRVCRHCKALQPLTVDQVLALRIEAHAVDRFAQVASGQGCPRCRGTGYVGRVGTFELLDVDGALREHIVNEGISLAAIRPLVQRTGLKTLRQSALACLAQGVTSFEEVIRVVGSTGEGDTEF